MSRSRKSGGGGKFGQFVFAIFVLALVVAIYQIPYDPGVKGISNVMQSKAEHAQEWAAGIAPSIESWIGDILRGGSEAPTGLNLPGGEGYDSSTGEGGNDLGTYDTEGSSNTQPGETYENGDGSAVSGAISILDGLKVSEAENVSYNRNEWRHWINVRSCLDVRQAVLIRDAVEGSLVMKDKNGNETKDESQACSVVSGKWIDPYSEKEFTNPRDLDIDHLVPLKYAATHGGQQFSKETKEKFANDMSYSQHLLAVSAKENRTKSDKGPGSYLPPNKNFHCNYADAWVTVTNNYGLSISQNDKETIASILSSC